MGYFAEVENKIVKRVIVADQKFIDTGKVGGGWIECSKDGSIRKNGAGIGYKYDEAKDAFIAPKPYVDWLLDDKTLRWKAPKEMPTDGNMYVWKDKDWVILNLK